jgi:hypothetical protein
VSFSFRLTNLGCHSTSIVLKLRFAFTDLKFATSRHSVVPVVSKGCRLKVPLFGWKDTTLNTERPATTKFCWSGLLDNVFKADPKSRKGTGLRLLRAWGDWGKSIHYFFLTYSHCGVVTVVHHCNIVPVL